MNLKQLKEMVAFEAKIPDIDALGAWLDFTIQSEFDQLTALVRYPELYEHDYPISAQTPTLPTNLQHLDQDNIRFQPDGDSDQEITLRWDGRVWGKNIGPTRYVYRQGNNLKFYPNSEMIVTDNVLINYWKRVPINPSLPDVELFVTNLIPTVLNRVIAKTLATAGDPKLLASYRSMAKEAHSNSFGTTDLGGANG